MSVKTGRTLQPHSVARIWLFPPPFFSCLNSCEQHRSAPQKLESREIVFFLSFELVQIQPRLRVFEHRIIWNCAQHETLEGGLMPELLCSSGVGWLLCDLGSVSSLLQERNWRDKKLWFYSFHSSKCNTLKVLLKRKQLLKADLYLLLPSSRESTRSEHSI